MAQSSKLSQLSVATNQNSRSRIGPDIHQRAFEQQQRRRFWPNVHKVILGFPELEACLNPYEKSTSLMRKIGEGSCAKVFLCKSKIDGSLEALKVVVKSTLSYDATSAMCNEITFLKKAHHHNVVKLRSVFHTPEHVLILMEFAGQASLGTYLSASRFKLEFGTAMEFHRQIIAGIGYCHRECIAHRDVKLENIMISDGESKSSRIRIVDFGCAVNATDLCIDLCGQVPFISPEVVLLSAGEHYIPTCVDMWACGVVLLDMLCGSDVMQRMLHWNTLPEANVECGQKLKSHFEKPAAVKANIEEEIGHSVDSMFLEQTTVALLGMLTPCPVTRWKVDQVEEFIQHVAKLDGTCSVEWA